MNWNRPLYAGLLVLVVCSSSSCTGDVGVCEGSLQGRDTVRVSDAVMYGGQAIMNKACATGCHLSTATGAARQGAPAGLDFDLLPVDDAHAAGTKTTAEGTVVKLNITQIAGLRARQRQIVEQRNSIWQQVQEGLMPPSGMWQSMMSAIFATSEATPCKLGKSYSTIDSSHPPEVLRNWLACGAPLVESSSTKVMTDSTLGAAGYQYPVCAKPADAAVTLESLLKSTFSDCGGCHSNPLAGPPEFGGLEVLAKSLRTKSVCGGEPFVTPGKPEKSYLIDLLKAPNPDCMHERMPGGGLDPLTDRAIAEVSAWIAAGAPTTAADVDTMPDESKDEPDTDTRDEADTDTGDEP